MDAPPKIMRAWQYSSTKGGLLRNLCLNPTTAVPEPGPHQLLVKVKAVALNPVDYKPAENVLLHRLAFPKPATPGMDFAGTVVSAPVDSTFEQGQVVFGVAKGGFAGGMLAEYAVSETDRVIPLAEGMTAAEGASMGIAGLTAYQSIVPRAKPRSRVFINGGSGGLGTFGVQIAIALGHQVTVTCSSRNVELCQSLGAEVIDYTKGSVLKELRKAAETRKFDLVIDNVFADPTLFWRAHEYTNPGAPYVLTPFSPSPRFLIELLKMKLIPSLLGGGKRRLDNFFSKPDMNHLAQIRDWCVRRSSEL